MRWVVALVSAVAFLLGGLWFLQGTGLVTLDPIACVGDCTALDGPSVPWAISGLLLMLVACGAAWLAFRRR